MLWQHRVAPHKIAEAEINSHIIVFTESYDILSASFDQRRRIAVARENLVLLKVDVDRMGPIESAFELPNLRRVALDPEANVVAVKQFIVDHPLAVPPVKLETPRDTFCHAGRHLVEGRVGRRIHAIVSHRVGDDAEL